LALAGREAWGATILSPERLRTWLIAGTAAALVTGVLATYIPLRRGLVAFRQLEFA
jgi:hypothetical protein